VRKPTEIDANSQRLLLNLETKSKNKKREEEEKNRLYKKNNRFTALGRNERQPGRILETVNSDNKNV